MINKIINTLAITILVITTFSCGKSDTKYVRIGTAQVSIQLIDGANQWPDSVYVAATGVTVLNSYQKFRKPTALTRDGNTWRGEIPMELSHSDNARIQIKNAKEGIDIYFFAGADQDKPLNISVTRNGKSDFSVSSSGGTGYIGAIKEESGGITDVKTLTTRKYHNRCWKSNIPDEIYISRSWSKFINYQLESIIPAIFDSTLCGSNIPQDKASAITEQLKRLYYIDYIIFYKEKAEASGEKRIPEPPVKYHEAYLKDINFSDEGLLDDCWNPTTIPFLVYLLRDSPLEIQPIGETDIPTWIKRTKYEVGKVIDSPTPLLMTLLATTSYLLQIQDRRIPLTETQISNINRFYQDDLGKIIFGRNEVIAKQVAKLSHNLTDLSDSADEWSLVQQLKEMDNEPVIVALWSPTSVPCHVAMRAIETSKENFSKRNINFLYVADTSSSPDDRWTKYANRQAGTHVRLSDREFSKLAAEYGVTALPVYLLFDSNHQLIDTISGFTDIESFASKLGSLSF